MHNQTSLEIIFSYAAPVTLLLFLLFFARLNIKKVSSFYQNSLAKQEEVIALLKEIRDLLKK